MERTGYRTTRVCDVGQDGSLLDVRASRRLRAHTVPVDVFKTERVDTLRVTVGVIKKE